MPGVTIRRGDGYSDILRRYKIEIDGKIVGTIRDGETHVFDVDEGRHNVRARIDWCSSKVVELDVGPDGADLTCAPNAMLPWLAIVLIFVPDQWIVLKSSPPAG